MGIFSKPSILGMRKKDAESIPEGLWHKCSSCGETIHQLDITQNLQVCPKCGHHGLLGARERIANLVDENSFVELDAELLSANPLGFYNYEQKAAQQRQKSGLNDAVVTGSATMGGHKVVLAVMDFAFFAGSMGSVVGEKITRAIEHALQNNSSMIIFSASSGARMQEGALSLMQMAKTCGALALLDEAGLGYISVLTHPTTGGVTASFATVGDVNLAEPGCMIGFAGPRVVKETTHQNLPAGFQTAEFMLEHGLLDGIVERRNMRERLIELLSYLQAR